MKKMVYEKPHATDFSDISAAAGTCSSGTPEYQVRQSCGSGGTAYNPCSIGSVVVENFTTCSTGGSAVFSCWHNGHLAG